MLHIVPVACKIKRSHEVAVKPRIIVKRLGRSLVLALQLRESPVKETNSTGSLERRRGRQEGDRQNLSLRHIDVNRRLMRRTRG